MSVAEAGFSSLDRGKQLMERVLERENLQAALRNVMRNGGSPGIDGMTVKDLPEYLKREWPKLRRQLLNGEYVPTPVRRVEIPKPGGGIRQLGIPTVLDRFVQQALLQVLQDEWMSPSLRPATASGQEGVPTKPSNNPRDISNRDTDG